MCTYMYLQPRLHIRIQITLNRIGIPISTVEKLEPLFFLYAGLSHTATNALISSSSHKEPWLFMLALALLMFVL